MNNDQTIIDEFLKQGRIASYHFADDSCKEWGLAKEAQNKALKLFDEHPELQERMYQESTHNFLWSLQILRPKT